MSESEALLRLRALHPDTAPIWEQARALKAFEEVYGALSVAQVCQRVGGGYTPSVVGRIRQFLAFPEAWQTQFQRLELGPHLVDELLSLGRRGLTQAQIGTAMANVPGGRGAGAEVKRQLWGAVDGGASRDLVGRLAKHLDNEGLPADARVDGDRVVLGPVATRALLAWLDERAASLTNLWEDADKILEVLPRNDPHGLAEFDMRWLVEALDSERDEWRILTSPSRR